MNGLIISKLSQPKREWIWSCGQDAVLEQEDKKTPAALL